MTPIPQIPLFSLVKHGKTYSDSPPPPFPSFLLPKNLSCVGSSCSPRPYMVLPPAVGGWVCGVQKVCGQKQEHFPSLSQFTGEFCGPRSPMENNSGVLFFVASQAGLTQGAMLHVFFFFFPVLFNSSCSPPAFILCNSHGVTTSRRCAF